MANILYFSRSYTGHDFRFIEAISKEDKIFYLKLDIDNIKYETRKLGSNIKVINWKNITFKKFLYKNKKIYIEELQLIIKKFNIDIIHSGPITTCSYLATKSTHSKPIISVSWGYDILRDIHKSIIAFNCAKEVLIKTTHFICDSAAITNSKIVKDNVSNNKILTFPWGVDLKFFKKVNLIKKNKIRSELGFTKKNIIIIHTRSWEKEPYDVMSSLKAFLLSFKKNNQIRLILVGDGSLRKQIHKFIFSNNLEEIIITPGYFSRPIAKYYQASDIYLSSSKIDGSSLSLLESLSCSLPVIITDIDGNKEWIKKGIIGKFCKIQNIKQFSLAINEISNKINIYAKLSKKNRSIVESYANWEINKKKINKVYKSICF